MKDFHDLSKLKVNNLGRFFIPKVNGVSEIVNMSQFERIISWVPHKLRIRAFHPVYVTSIDGYSLRNLYRKIGDLDKQTPLVLLFTGICITEDNQGNFFFLYFFLICQYFCLI